MTKLIAKKCHTLADLKANMALVESRPHRGHNCVYKYTDEERNFIGLLAFLNHPYFEVICKHYNVHSATVNRWANDSQTVVPETAPVVSSPKSLEDEEAELMARLAEIKRQKEIEAETRVRLPLNQTTVGTAYQKITYKVIEAMKVKPKTKEVYVDGEGEEWYRNDKMQEDVAYQLKVLAAAYNIKIFLDGINVQS